MKKGKLIVIDSSNDRIGKTTVLNKFTSMLDNLGISWVTRHFNNADAITGQYINYLLNPSSPTKINALPWKMVTQLYMIDFKDSAAWIEEQLNNGTYVILDRYYSSAVLYETAIMMQQTTHSSSTIFTPAEKDLIIDTAKSIKGLAIEIYHLPKPDITFLLHADNIIDEFYTNVPNQSDNLESRAFQSYLIEIFKILTSSSANTTQVYDNPILLPRLTSDGQIIESGDIVKRMIEVIANVE